MPGAVCGVFEDFPTIQSGGSIPPSEIEIIGHVAEALGGNEWSGFPAAIEKKSGLDLSGRPTMFTICRRCQRTDGKIYTDKKDMSQNRTIAGAKNAQFCAPGSKAWFMIPLSRLFGYQGTRFDGSKERTPNEG